MSLPSKIIPMFTKVPLNAVETEFHGSYNTLLGMVFPPDSDFTVIPHFTPCSAESAHDRVSFKVTFKDQPVLILELKHPSNLRYASKRRLADHQSRDLIVQLNEDHCPLPVLHVISAMGTKLCFYSKHQDAHCIQPSYISTCPYETDTAPVERWNYDIREEEGLQKFITIIREIKQGCADL
ncbi:hypothetical protein ABKN59_004211 [Abortiporus biennis]